MLSRSAKSACRCTTCRRCNRTTVRSGAQCGELSRLGLDDLSDNLDFTRRPVPVEIETDTLFTQVCGYPLQTIYRRQATLLGAPVYADKYCKGATHCGVFVVGAKSRFKRLEDLRGCR